MVSNRLTETVCRNFCVKAAVSLEKNNTDFSVTLPDLSEHNAARKGGKRSNSDLMFHGGSSLFCSYLI